AVRAWYDDSKELFVVVFARRGVVFYHEAFGDVNRDIKFPTASITKFIAGLLFVRFIDQGLIQPDDAVGKYLSDWPSSGPNAITLRQCFTHTSGLGGLGDVWVEGPWLDNQLANALPIVEPGKRFEYTWLGYVVAGKVMETVS